MQHGPMSSVTRTVAELGGCATWRQLRRRHRRRPIREAEAAGELVRAGRGRYVLASVGEHRRVAHARSATLSHLSAALHHGWGVKAPPTAPWITAPRGRRLRPKHYAGTYVHRADLTSDDIEDGVTTPLRTVLDCARTLPFDEALAVADSALRAGHIAPAQLVLASEGLRGPGAAQARRVARHADGRAANPLESVLRAIALDIPGIQVSPQQTVADEGVFAVVDLADPRRRLVLEAEGFEYHGSRDQWRKDCRRYTGIVSAGWWVLRFTYEDVMHHPEVVRAAIERWLANRPDRQDIAA